MRTLTLGGITGSVLFSVVAVIGAALRSDYSHLTNFISELGATGTPFAPLMNYAGFIPAGLMFAAFGAGLAGTLPRHWLTMVASVLVMVFGLGMAASGVISCDPGCPPAGGSVGNSIHDTIAPITFLSLILGAGILGIYFRRAPDWHSLSAYSLVTAGLALIFLVGLASTLETREFTGLWQRLLLGTLFLWCAVVSIRAFRGPASSRHAS